MIEVKNISLQVAGKKDILKNVSINITPGQLTAVIGKNGAGKSTLLKTICGESRLSSGAIFIEGVHSSEFDSQNLAKRRAVVSQKSTLDFAFKVREVVSLGRAPHSGFFNSKNDDEIVTLCLQKVDMDTMSDRSYITLSGGEQQRVHMARALAQIWNAVEDNFPCYLFLDEPLASLDVANQHEILHLLKQLCKKNVGVFIVIHDLNLAAQYADYVHIMKKGTTFVEGTPVEVFTEETIHKAFDHPVRIVPHPKTNCPLIVAEAYT